MKKRNIYLPLFLLWLGITGVAKADDTEIYLNSNNNAAPPLVMFHIEYISSLNSSVCSGVTATDKATLKSECDNNADTGLQDLGGYFAAHDLDDGKISRWEMIRAALKRVLTPLDSMKAGLMISHAQADLTHCGSTPGCSDGGYILRGFTTLDALPSSFHITDPTSTDWALIAGTTKQDFFDTLDNLPEPQGNLSHPNQNKEVYFELFRYLEGFNVLNAFNGWSDFGTDDTKNIGNEDDCINNNKEVATVPCPATVTPPIDSALVGTGTLHLGPDTSIIDITGIHKKYISPLDTDCQKVFVINVLDGAGNSNNDADTEIAETYANEGMHITVRNGDPGFVDMLAWLHDIDLADGGVKNLPDGTTQACDPTTVVNCNLDLMDQQNVTSYFIAYQVPQLQDEAIAGGTRRAYPLTDDPNSIIDTLNSVFNQILSVSTTFVSASIPVNVFNRSEVLDNVFVALFKTDRNGAPSWPGNIKKLKLDIRTNTVTNVDYLEIIDANQNPAIANDGRIDYGALTYWTNPNGYDVVGYDPDLLEQTGKDGRSINRGGAGQQIPNFLDGNAQGSANLNNDPAGRQLYTEYNNNLLPLIMGNMSVIWPSMFNPSDSYTVAQWDSAAGYSAMNGTWSNDYSRTYTTSGCDSYFYWTGTPSLFTPCWVGDMASNILAYIRGRDADDEDGDGNRTETRRWIFGDPLHSRPLPINYGARAGHTNTNPDIRIVAGSNDGFFRMFENTDSSGNELGKENWAFMPREAIAIQKQLMENTPDNAHTHLYGVDGAPVAYMLDNNHNGTIETPDTDNNNDKVYVYFGMRRGGKGYYALDISNPDSPSFLWKITKTSGGDFDELGLTFSTPVVRHLDWGNGSKPVLIFGGGYDTNKDTQGSIGTDDTEGNAIYVVDAETGALVWKAVQGNNSATNTKFEHPDLVDSIPSALTVVDTTGDGNADRAYVGDTGGTVWRVDFNGTDRTNWSISKVLVAGRHYNSTLADDRRFFHAPDFVPARDSSGNFDGIVIGSGNRAHPQDVTTKDFVYMIKDRDISALSPSATDTWLLHDSSTASETMQDITNDCLQYSNCDSTTFDLSNGWKLQLEDSGEKSLASPFTLSGDVYFNTYVPNSSGNSQTCGPSEGWGYAYRISFQEGNAVQNYDTTKGGTDSTGQATDLGKEDRRKKLDSGGIPSENVYISYRETDPSTGETKKISCTMTPDFTCEESGKNAAWRTFWYKKEE